MQDAGQEYCSRSWSSIQSEMSDIKNTEAYCFRYGPWPVQICTLCSEDLPTPAVVHVGEACTEKSLCMLPGNDVENVSSWSESIAPAWLFHRAPFVSILLQDGLGILPSHVSIVEGGFSWTLGAAISEGVRLAGFGTGSC